MTFRRQVGRRDPSSNATGACLILNRENHRGRQHKAPQRRARRRNTSEAPAVRHPAQARVRKAVNPSHCVMTSDKHQNCGTPNPSICEYTVMPNAVQAAQTIRRRHFTTCGTTQPVVPEHGARISCTYRTKMDKKSQSNQALGGARQTTCGCSSMNRRPVRQHGTACRKRLRSAA